MHRGEDTSGEDASGEDTSGEDTSDTARWITLPVVTDAAATKADP